jgi:uncharacterized membrane protein (DUF485 family)
MKRDDVKPHQRGGATAVGNRLVQHAHINDLDSDIWERVAGMDEFHRLLAAKKKFVIPATIFFIVYYFALPISVGYFPEVMSKKVIGPVNLAYLFALSQFFMAWGMAWAYIRVARKFDAAASRIFNHLNQDHLNNPVSNRLHDPLTTKQRDRQ